MFALSGESSVSRYRKALEKYHYRDVRAAERRLQKRKAIQRFIRQREQRLFDSDQRISGRFAIKVPFTAEPFSESSRSFSKRFLRAISPVSSPEFGK